MKTFLFSILIVLSSLFTLNAQANPLFNYSGWQHSANGVTNYGVSSFYYAIFRTTYPVDASGNYQYQVWFSSSSYVYDYQTGNAILRPTYIYGIYLTINGHLLNPYGAKDISVIEARPLSSLNYYCKNPNISWFIKWGGSSIL